MVVFSLPLGVGLLVGCVPGLGLDSGPGRIPADSLPVEAYPQVVPLDGVADLLVAPSSPVVRRDEARGLLTVRVPLRSIVDDTIQLRYRFQYFDADGAELERDPWHGVAIAGRTAFELTGRTLRSQARTWRLEIGLELH